MKHIAPDKNEIIKETDLNFFQTFGIKTNANADNIILHQKTSVYK